MKAGDAFWAGKDGALDVAIWRRVPKCLDAEPFANAAKKHSGLYRNGVGYSRIALDGFSPIKPFASAWRLSMETAVAAEECTERATAAVEKLEAVVSKFRTEIKNDLASMKAASQRVQDETARMRDRYLAAQSVLTSPEFERAIANAERMAAALKNLAEARQTSLVVSILSSEEDKQ